jgi:hypothetical protein
MGSSQSPADILTYSPLILCFPAISSGREKQISFDFFPHCFSDVFCRSYSDYIYRDAWLVSLGVISQHSGKDTNGFSFPEFYYWSLYFASADAADVSIISEFRSPIPTRLSARNFVSAYMEPSCVIL